MVLGHSSPRTREQYMCNGVKPHGVGNSLAVQWLGLGAFTAESPVSIPGQGTEIPQATQRSQKKKKKPPCLE